MNPAYETLGEPAVPLDDLKRFRQLDSKCPGHPEYRWTSGVEATTGPLGTGAATSVGMAIAARWQAAYFNRPGHELFDYDVYALCGDGDLMEGVAAEAASLAGHLRLANLCWIYDNNQITIEGDTALAFTEDVATRFIGLRLERHPRRRRQRPRHARRAPSTPSEPSPADPRSSSSTATSGTGPRKQGTAAAHGEPLGADDVRATKRFYGWPEDAQFRVPDQVYGHLRRRRRAPADAAPATSG